MEKEERVPSHPRPSPPPPTTYIPTAFGGLCSYVDADFDVTLSVVCAMLLTFGVVYSVFGYRCFKAVMFLTGFIFGSVIVYLICLEENLLTQLGNVAAAVGAGILFGLITMLVQYVGLFMTGFHTGLLTGVIALVVMDHFDPLKTVWTSVAVLMGCGLVFAVLTLYWQKGLTVIGTSIYGGAIMAAGLDYFVEKFIMVHWIWDKVKVAPPARPCWFSWLVLAIWPFMIIIGSATQFCVTGSGTYHQELLPVKKPQHVNLQRMRTQEMRASQKQRRYRYLYQVRTAHGDVITQSYIQSLQSKASPSSGMRSERSCRTQTSTFNACDSANTTMSHVP